MKESRLKELYEEYVNIELYHVFPERQLTKILKQGFNPKNDPYEKIKPEIKKLAKIIRKIENKGKIIKINWGRPVYASYVLSVSLNDLALPYVDFAPTLEDVNYYLKLEGGALVSNILKITEEIKGGNIELSKEDWRVVNYLNKWSKKSKCKNKVTSIRGNISELESAKFQIIKRGKGKRKNFKKNTYLKSPFGSFEHFKKTIKKDYRKYLTNLKSKNYYIRVTEKVPKDKIKIK